MGLQNKFRSITSGSGARNTGDMFQDAYFESERRAESCQSERNPAKDKLFSLSSDLDLIAGSGDHNAAMATLSFPASAPPLALLAAAKVGHVDLAPKPDQSADKAVAPVLRFANG